MKVRNSRIEALKQLIANNEMGSQLEILDALHKKGFKLTQATLSRDMRLLKVAKATSPHGRSVFVLPHETMYRRIHGNFGSAAEMLHSPGFKSINFSGNICVIRTRPGYASSIAYNIDNADIPEILGTIAGDDTIFLVVSEDATREQVVSRLKDIIPVEA